METIQNIYYILGIAFMVSWLLLFIGIVVIGIIVYRKVTTFKEDAVEKGKTEIASLIGGVVSSVVASGIKRIFSKKHH